MQIASTTAYAFVCQKGHSIVLFHEHAGMFYLVLQIIRSKSIECGVCKHEKSSFAGYSTLYSD